MTRYGRKLIKDGGDAYYADNEPIGEDVVCSVDASFRADISMPMLNAALIVNNSAAAYERHIRRLAHHKKLGDTTNQIGIKIVDYTLALSRYPEYVVAAVCRSFIENYRRPFVPFIAEMKDACEQLWSALESKRVETRRDAAPVEQRIEGPSLSPVALRHRSEKAQSTWDMGDWRAEVEALRTNLALAKENPGLMDAAIWEKRLLAAQKSLLEMGAA